MDRRLRATQKASLNRSHVKAKRSASLDRGNRFSAIVMCGLLGVSLPFAVPQIARDDYRASVRLHLDGIDVFEPARRSQLLADLSNRLHDRTILNRAIQSLNLSPSSFDQSAAPSYFNLLWQLSGLASMPSANSSDQLLDNLRERFRLVAQVDNDAVLQLSADAPTSTLAAQLVEAMSLYLSAEVQSIGLSNTSDAMSNARQELESVEAELTGFQMRFGDEKISEMSELKQRHAILSTHLERLRNTLADVRAAIVLAKKMKPTNALDESLPDVLGFDPLRELQNRYLTAKAIIRDLSVSYGDKHPKMIAAQSHIADLKKATPRAVQQSIEALNADEVTFAKDLAEAEKEYSDLENALVQLGNAPDDYALLEKRLDAARQHYLSLAELEPNSTPESHNPISIRSDKITVSSQYNWTKLLSFSGLSGVFCGFGAYLVRRRRELAVGQSDGASEKGIRPPLTVPKMVSDPAPPPQIKVAPSAPVKASPASMVQDNDAPFDVQVKKLLMRHAQKERQGEKTSLPPLVELAREGKLQLTAAEKIELHHIRRELETLRENLHWVERTKTRRG